MRFWEWFGHITVLYQEVGKSRDQRYGQWLFNELRRDYPELAEEIRASVSDPFYDDSKIPAFCTYLVKEWDR